MTSSTASAPTPPQSVPTCWSSCARSVNTGLLDGVGITFDPGEFEPYEAPTPLDVGEEFEPFTLIDLDGNERSLTEWRGGRVLVVNWAPECGFCTMITPHFAELQGHLTEREIHLLFVSSGDADTNRAILTDAGIDATMVLKGDAPDPFVGFGTPVAYLLDDEGRVAANVGWGANQVLDLLQDITGVTLENNPFAPAAEVLVDEAADQPAEPDDGPTFKYLPAPGGT